MSESELIDTHAHLEQVVDIAESLERAKASGVAAVVAVGMDLTSNKRTIELSEEWSGFVFPALGIHPWSLEESELNATAEFIENNIDRCVAIGEIGLDYWIKKDKELQRKAFGRLLQIAVASGKPALTHSRGSYEDVFEMVRDAGVNRAVFHWYSGPVEMAEKIVDCGYHISATPAVEYSKKHRQVIAATPLENLILETDCPVKYNEIPSEPASVGITLREVARLKSEDPDVVASVTTQNARALFAFPDAKK
jgi:TatD DNase family protein